MAFCQGMATGSTRQPHGHLQERLSRRQHQSSPNRLGWQISRVVERNLRDWPSERKREDISSIVFSECAGNDREAASPGRIQPLDPLQTTDSRKRRVKDGARLAVATDRCVASCGRPDGLEARCVSPAARVENNTHDASTASTPATPSLRLRLLTALHKLYPVGQLCFARYVGWRTRRGQGLRDRFRGVWRAELATLG